MGLSIKTLMSLPFLDLYDDSRAVSGMLAITAVVGGGAQAGVIVVPPRLQVLGWEGELEVGEGVHGE